MNLGAKWLSEKKIISRPDWVDIDYYLHVSSEDKTLALGYAYLTLSILLSKLVFTGVNILSVYLI